MSTPARSNATAPYTVSLDELAGMSAPKKREVVGDMARASMASPNGEIARMSALLAEFERAHGMTTSEMVAKFRAGELPDTPEIASWLIFAKRRGG